MGSRRPRNLGLLFDWHAEAGRKTVMHLDQPFDVAPDGGRVYTVPALAELVRSASGWLYEAGLRPGDRLAICKDNHYDAVILAAAAARLGAVPANLAPINSLEAIRIMISRIKPTVAVLGASVLAQAAAAGTDLAGRDPRVVVVGKAGEGIPERAVHLDDLRGAPPPPPSPRPDDAPMIMTHSSGTTGVPKLVVHAANTILGKASRTETVRFPIVASKHDDIVASCVTFAHARIVSWTAGQLALEPQKLVILSDHRPAAAAAAIREHRPTSLEACPNIFVRWEELTETQPELFSQVRLYVSTFDAIHPRTVRKFLSCSTRRFPVWGQSWGQSEVGPVTIVFYTRRGVRERDDARSATSPIGWAVPPMARVRIVDPETGRRLGRGQPGIMMVASQGRCLGYLEEMDRHQEKARGKWWNTGDVGERGWFRRLKLIDREVDIIPGTSGIDLESVLLDRLTTASEVTILGVPGRLPVPVLCMRDDKLDPAEWRRVAADLPELGEPYLIPWDDVPRTHTWKVRRLELREKVLGTVDKSGTGKWT